MTMSIKSTLPLLVLSLLGLMACTKEINQEGTGTLSTSVDTRTNGCTLEAQLLYPLLTDQSLSDAAITQQALEIGVLCDGALTKLIKGNQRTLNQADLTTILVYNAPLSDHVLQEVLKLTPQELSSQNVEEIVAWCLPLSPTITNKVSVKRPDVTIPTPDQDVYEWLSQNAGQLSQVERAEILQFEGSGQQRIIFQNLSPVRQAKMWQQNVAAFASSRTLTTNQQTIINDVLGSINADVFSSKQDNGLPTKDALLKAIRTDVYSAFQPYQAVLILNELDDCLRPISGGGGQLPGCSCSSESDWCDWPVDAGGCTGNCATAGNLGCGTLWTYPCDNICELSAGAR